MDRIEKLIKMLDSPKASTRYDACEWLRVAPSLNDAAIAALERASKDSDPEVRDAAQKALNLHQMDEIEKFTKSTELPTIRMPIAASFGLAIVLNALAILVVDRAVYGGQLGGSYLSLCLPASAVILALGAGAGALVAKGFGDSPWRGATIGVWIGAVASVALSLAGLLGIGPGA